MPADGSGPSRRQVLRWLAGAGVGVAAGAVAVDLAFDGSDHPGRRPAPLLRSGGLDVTDFGAVGDGHTDDTAAVQRALTALRPGGVLTFPRDHVFTHNNVLQVTTPNVWLQGPGTIKATAEATSALQIQADGVTLSDLTVAMGPTTMRWGAPEQHKIFLGGHRNITLQQVTVDSSAAAGVFVFGATSFRLIDVAVKNTRADGIHMTNGASDGVVTRPRVTSSGDDGVAVVSYLDDDAVCRSIHVDTPTVHTTTGGRGISVVGGEDIAYNDVDVSGSNAAAVYLACEGGDFVTRSTRRVNVLRGKIRDANTNASIDHGAILIYSGRAGGTVSDVTVTGMQVRDTRADASRQIGAIADAPDDGMSGVVFRDLDLAASPDPYEGNAPVSALRLADVMAAGRAVRATVTR